MAMVTTKKLWGGRFTGKVDPLMEKYNESLSFDKRLYKEDITGSIAYASALAKCDLLTVEEEASIHGGLQTILNEWATNTFIIHPNVDEDIHTANERRLSELIGPVAGKLHTGRSRNDQVVTDMRLYMRRICDESQELLRTALSAFTDLADEHLDLLMPGFTHLQPAQPIRFSHWVLSHAAALQRDATRLDDLRVRVNVCPLGSGALAGNAFGIDRAFLASTLGFDRSSLNSLDAVSNRDFVAEYMFWASMLMVHLSQFSEDLIVYNTMKCVTIADAYSTGSSLMPQKKNPDALELLRGKTGRIVGRLTGFLVTLKGLPRSYNKDLQEDKEALFDVIDTVHDCLSIASGVIVSTEPNPDALAALLVPEMLATDLAEYLVRKGVPFRETHHVAGAAVRLAEEKHVRLSELSCQDLQTLHAKFEPDVVDIWNFEASVERKNVPGGTSRESVQTQITWLRNWINRSSSVTTKSSSSST